MLTNWCMMNCAVQPSAERSAVSSLAYMADEDTLADKVKSSPPLKKKNDMQQENDDKKANAKVKCRTVLSNLWREKTVMSTCGMRE